MGEPLIVLTALGSYLGTPKRIREANNFSFHRLKEIAWLFLGIFGTMIPVLVFMERSAGEFGLRGEFGFYRTTGLLSALLDNAPTDLAFFAAVLGLQGLDLKVPLGLPPSSATMDETGGGLASRDIFRRSHLHRQRAESTGQGHR